MQDDPLIEKWPYYIDGTAEHIYAIGKVSARFNALEAHLLDMIERFTKGHLSVVDYLFERVPNNIRLIWLALAMEADRVRPDLKAAIECFVEGYSACSDNRNLLVHAQIWGSWLTDNSAIVRKRVRSTGKLKDYKIPLETIQQVADEIEFWERYGSHILSYLNRKAFEEKPLAKAKGVRLFGPTTLPQICEPPKKLADSFPHTQDTP